MALLLSSLLLAEIKLTRRLTDRLGSFFFLSGFSSFTYLVCALVVLIHSRWMDGMDKYSNIFFICISGQGQLPGEVTGCIFPIRYLGRYHTMSRHPSEETKMSISHLGSFITSLAPATRSDGVSQDLLHFSSSNPHPLSPPSLILIFPSPPRPAPSRLHAVTPYDIARQQPEIWGDDERLCTCGLWRNVKQG